MAFSKLLTFSHFPQLLKIQPTAWFHNFHNARDIISRLGVEDNFQRWEVHDLMYKNYQPERMYSHGIFPLNLAGMVHCPLSLFLSFFVVCIWQSKIPAQYWRPWGSWRKTPPQTNILRKWGYFKSTDTVEHFLRRIKTWFLILFQKDGTEALSFSWRVYFVQYCNQYFKLCINKWNTFAMRWKNA